MGSWAGPRGMPPYWKTVSGSGQSWIRSLGLCLRLDSLSPIGTTGTSIKVGVPPSTGSFSPCWTLWSSKNYDNPGSMFLGKAIQNRHNSRVCADLISLSFPRGKSLIKALYAIIILNVLYSQKGNPLLIADIMSNLSSSS